MDFKPGVLRNLFGFILGLLALSSTLPAFAAPLLQGGPEINVLDGTTSIPDNTGSVSFPNTTVGNGVNKVFTIQNTGSGPLNVANLGLPPGFSLTAVSGPTTIPAGGSITFTVRCNAASVGTFSGMLNFQTDDANENPYNFTITCTVNQGSAPEINVLDGATQVQDNGGVTFPQTTIGSPVSKTLTIQNTGGGNLIVSNLSLPAGFTLTAVSGPTTIPAGGSITFTVRCNATADGAFSGQLSFTTNDADENPYNFSILCIVNSTGTPEINVRDGATNVPDNTGSVTFPVATVGSPTQKTFTVQNTASGATLALSSVSVPAGFSLIGQSGTTIPPNSSGTIAIRCNAASAGTFSGQLSISNNDPNENPYNFTISCTVNAGGTPEINVRDGATNIPDGTGSVTFPAATEGAPTQKTFTVQNTGNANLTLANLSLPNGFALTGVSGTTVTPGSSITFTVRCNAASAGTFSGQLSFTNNDANENPYNFTISCTVSGTGAPEINVRDGATNIPDNTGSVTFPTTVSGSPVSKTFTVQNTGSAALTAANMTLPAGFTLTAVSGPTTIPAGGSITFTVRCNAATPGTFSGQLSFTNNDANENPYNFTISCTVNARGPEIAVMWGQLVIPDNTGGVSDISAIEGQGTSLTLPIVNSGDQVLTVSNPNVVPAGFTAVIGDSVTSINPGGVAFLVLTCTGESVGTFSGQLSFTNNDADENPYNFQVTCTVEPAVREINVTIAETGVTIPDNTGSVTFPATTVGNPVEMAFNIFNEGNTGVEVGAYSVPTGFTMTQPPSAPVSGSFPSTFRVRCDATAPGTYSGTVSFSNTDPDENPYNFTISCTVSAAAAVQGQQQLPDVVTEEPTATEPPVVTDVPTEAPTVTPEPTDVPTEIPTEAPTETPTPEVVPTQEVTAEPPVEAPVIAEEPSEPAPEGTAEAA